jgi:hypothetical protein
MATETEIKKLTLTDLIKEKEKYQVKENTTQSLLIDRIGSYITIRKPERSLCLEAFQMAGDENQAENADIFIAYNIIVEPNLKDPQLQKEYECAEPQDIIEKIFESGEISQIAGAGMELAGYNSNIKKVNDIKN